MKAQNNSNRDGGVLVMAMMIMLIFTTLAIGLFKLKQTDALETIYLEHHNRAFWMAETGMEKTWDRLQNDPAFRADPGSYVPYTVPYTQGIHTNDSYKIASVTAAVVSSGTVYTVTSVGYAGNMNRRIEQAILVMPGGPNALRAKGGDIDIGANILIEGDIYADTGNITLDTKENLNSQNPTGVDGYVVVNEGIVDGNGAATANIIEAPAQPEPNIDMTYWQPYLDDVTNNANTSGLTGVSAINMTTIISNFNYSAAVLESDNTLKLTISGSVNDANKLHYMVSATDVLFRQWTLLKAQTVIVVEGDATFSQKLEFEDNCVVFATGDIHVEQSSDAGGTGATLVAQGDITIASSAVFHGIIYAEGSVNVGSDASIDGTIIAGDGITLEQNAHITYDPDTFLNPLPGLVNVRSKDSLSSLSWKETAPE